MRSYMKKQGMAQKHYKTHTLIWVIIIKAYTLELSTQPSGSKQFLVISSWIQQAQVAYSFYRAKMGHWWILKFSAFQYIWYLFNSWVPWGFHLLSFKQECFNSEKFYTKDPNEVNVGGSVLIDERESLFFLFCIFMQEVMISLHCLPGQAMLSLKDSMWNFDVTLIMSLT